MLTDGRADKMRAAAVNRRTLRREIGMVHLLEGKDCVKIRNDVS
jgi:hypothetical protein